MRFDRHVVVRVRRIRREGRRDPQAVDAAVRRRVHAAVRARRELIDVDAPGAEPATTKEFGAIQRSLG